MIASEYLGRTVKKKYLICVIYLYFSLAAAAVAMCLQVRAGGREAAVEESFGDSDGDVDNNN